MVNKKELSGSQRELLQLKNQKMQLAAAQLQAAIEMIAIEVGIPIEEHKNWKLSTDFLYFEEE